MTVARSFRGLTPVPADEPLTKAVDVATYLGVSLQTLYDWRKHGRGPRGYRVGGRIQFRMSEVNTWLEQQREPLAADTTDPRVAQLRGGAARPGTSPNQK